MADLVSSMIHFAPQTTSTASQIIPPGYRPDLYVSDLFREAVRQRGVTGVHLQRHAVHGAGLHVRHHGLRDTRRRHEPLRRLAGVRDEDGHSAGHLGTHRAVP